MSSATRCAEVRAGDTTVTFLPDGEAWIVPSAAFPASTPEQWAGHLTDGRLRVGFGAFLIRTPTAVVLVDLGIGPVDHEVPGVGHYRGGALLDSLAEAGLGPADVDSVVFTHLHHDHVGWTTDGSGALTFPAARHLVHADEWAYWVDSDSRIAPDRVRVRTPLAGRVGFVGDGEEVAAGVRVLATPGHTPGHLSVLVTSPDTRVLIAGDVLHTPAQLAHGWDFVSDVDLVASRRSRSRVLALAGGADVVLADGHFAPDVFGRVVDGGWTVRRRRP